MNEFPVAIAPTVEPEGVNAPIRVYHGDGVVFVGGDARDTDLDVELQWHPTPRLKARVSIPGGFRSNDTIRIQFPGLGSPWEVLVLRVTMAGTVEVHGLLNDVATVGNVDVQVDHVDFTLFNFHHFHLADAIRDAEGTGSWRGRRSVELGDWVVLVDQRRDIKEAIEEVKFQGGVTWTHGCRIGRTDGRAFRWSAARPVLDHFRLILSFARGMRISPVMPTGWGAGEIVWREVSAPMVQHWMSVRSWYPRTKPAEMRQLAERVGQISTDRDQWHALHHAVWWYVEAGATKSADTRTVLCCTALELLGWSFLVEDLGCLDADEFDARSASGKIRVLLSEASIGPEIPASFPDLRRFARGFSDGDGPDCIVEIRNALVHSSKKKRRRLASSVGHARFEAAELAMFYVEAVLLYRLGYTGIFRDRRLRGVYEAEAEVGVPWSS